MDHNFKIKNPQLEDYWRSIILYGRNVASYKFALAKSLLELQPQSGELVKLGDLAPVFSKHISEHLKNVDRQGTSRSSKFLDACRKFNSGSLSKNELVDITVKEGFNNVIDAFHIVGRKPVPKLFYIDERRSNKGIRITDEFSELLSKQQSVNLPQEVEARWNLVEEAWRLNISSSLISIGYDDDLKSLFSLDNKRRRKDITSGRDALNGYQKGKCFYCFCDISLNEDSGDLFPDVDHFFPHTLKQHNFQNINGVWNLVLSCQNCNRGQGGKFDLLPTQKLLERLHRRNEFLISSHHPLRETLILQTGKSEKNRSQFLETYYNKAWSVLIHRWEAKEKDKPYF